MDAAKALARLDRFEDALRLLKLVPGDDAALASLREAIQVLQASAVKKKAPPRPPKPIAPAVEEAAAVDADAPAEIATPIAEVPTAAPVPREVRAPNPFLGLDGIARSEKGGVFRRSASRSISDGWKWCLILEKRGNFDDLADSLSLWRRHDLEPALGHYLAGLQHWQSGDSGSARTAFRAAVDPAPILNPALYWLLLQMDEDAAAQTAWNALRTMVTEDERRRCRTGLLQFLENRPDMAGPRRRLAALV